MIVALAFHSGDVAAAHNLLLWIGQLGDAKAYHCALVADDGVSWIDASKALELARTAFASVELFTTGRHVVGWIEGSNSLWLKAAQVCSLYREPWLFIEPDTVPLSADWLLRIEREYINCLKPYMGTFISTSTPGIPNPYMEGIAVYPPSAFLELAPLVGIKLSWTNTTAIAVVPKAHNTLLIHHIWGENGNPPTFAEKNIPGTNVFCLQQIRNGAVIFHRSKDGSLIRLLRSKSGHSEPVSPIKPIKVVLPFCERDANLLLSNLNWQAEMAGRLPATAILHYDSTIGTIVLASLETAANRAYESVVRSHHSKPPRPGWPAGPNWSFQAACKFMGASDAPWIWLEPDAVPLKPDWLSRLDQEYRTAQKPFMGTIIGGMGHMNGVGVYPPNVMTYAPGIFSCSDTPWDVWAQREIVPHVHRANHLIFHCRAVQHGHCVDTHGSPPIFRNPADLANMTTSQMCVFHPSKDGSLIVRLRARKNGH